MVVWAVRLTAIVVAHCSSKSAPSMGAARETPALLTRMSGGPSRSAISATADRTASPSVTSTLQPAAVPPAAVISSTTAATPAAVRSSTATLAPSSANRWAVARPMPIAAPVITATRPATERLPCVSLAMGGDHTAGVRHPTATALWTLVGIGGDGTTIPTLPAESADFTVSNVGGALLFACLAAVPLGVSLWALLDAARRPRWAWALAERRQVMWMAVIMFGVLSVVGGLLISGWYLTKVRPRIAAAEAGRF